MFRIYTKNYNASIHRMFLILLFLALNLKCNNEESKRTQVNQLVENWNVLTEQAVLNCNDTLAARNARNANGLIKWVGKHQLRERILRQLLDITDFQETLYIVEELTGDDLSYSVSIKIDQRKPIYLFKFSEEKNKIVSQILDESSEGYKYYIPQLEPWDDFIDSVTPYQKIFDCGHESWSRETIFRIKL